MVVVGEPISRVGSPAEGRERYSGDLCTLAGEVCPLIVESADLVKKK
jgi:hypothetical protein